MTAENFDSIDEFAEKIEDLVQSCPLTVAEVVGILHIVIAKLIQSALDLSRVEGGPDSFEGPESPAQECPSCNKPCDAKTMVILPNFRNSPTT